MLLILFLILIILLGYLWSYPFLRGTSYFIKFGYSIFLGAVIFILFTSILSGSSISVVFLVAFLIVGGFNIGLKKLSHNRTLANGISFSKTEIIAFFSVFFVYVIIYSRQATLDTLFHFFFAEQIKLGKIPPAIHGFPQYPVKYHYGYDLLLGTLKQFTSVNYATLSSLLSLLLIYANISIAAAYLKKRKFDDLHFAVALILIFLGGGFFSIAKFLIYKETSSGLSLSSLFGQSSWVFGVAFLFLLLDFFNDFKLGSPKETMLKSVYLFPVLISAGLLTTSGYVLVILAFVILTVHIVLSYKIRESYFVLFGIIFYFILFYFLSRVIGGMFIRGDYLDKPVFIIAPLKVGTGIYSMRIAAYLFALAPIGLYALYYLIKKFIKKPALYFKTPLHDFSLNTIFLALFTVPLIIWMENAAIWDNFCKFNIYGVLAAWILFADSFLRKRFSRDSSKHLLLIIGLIALLLNESIIKIVRGYDGTNQLKVYSETVRKNEKFLDAVRGNIPLDSRIYLLNSDLNCMYEVDRKTNDSKINLYKYINENFGRFDLIAMEAGRSVCNFYNFDIFINRDLEYELWDILDELYRGNPDVLTKVKNDYIISSFTKLPIYAELWQKEGRIGVIEKSVEEDWIIFKVLN